jgi:threonine synthase
MEYISTRGSVSPVPSKKAILKGIAGDNGLYVPSSFPFLGPNLFADIHESSYAARANRILNVFLTDYTEAELHAASQGAYGENFDSPSTAPVRSLGNGISVLELWHGPTLAFKDMALQIMPRLLTYAIQSQEERYKVVILVATSGDTGKAALEGFADVEGVWIFVFYPHQGVSEIQRLQMVTQRGPNVGACGVIGNFDDAQTGVKQIFSDAGMNGRLEAFHYRLSSANSINWGRLAPQIAYYFTGYEEMVLAGEVARGESINICVPTGNFGNILAAYYAVRCGLPVSKLICASNINNVLTDFIRTGVYDRRREFHKTESPSMDILISSNLERLLFELVGRKPDAVSGWMTQLTAQGWYQIPRDALDQLQSRFYGGPEIPGPLCWPPRPAPLSSTRPCWKPSGGISRARMNSPCSKSSPLCAVSAFRPSSPNLRNCLRDTPESATNRRWERSCTISSAWISGENPIHGCPPASRPGGGASP